MSYTGYSNSPSYVASGAAGSVVNSSAGNYGQSNYSGFQSQAQAQAGLQGYSGLSVSSEAIDFNSLGPIGYPTSSGAYGGVAPYGSYGSYGAVTALNCAPSQPLDVNDPNLLAQVEQIVQSLNEVKRPMLRRQVVTVPAAYQGRVANISRRLPTPPPDIIERITVVKPPRDVVNLNIEKPCQPGPCFQQRQICGKPRRPIIQPRVIPVVPRSNPCAPPPPPPPPQPVYVPPQPVCVPPPQPVCMPPPQPVCVPPPQPVCAPPPQPVCVPPPQPVCLPQPTCFPTPQLYPQTQDFGMFGQAAFGQFGQSAFQQNQFGAFGQPNYFGSGFNVC